MLRPKFRETLKGAHRFDFREVKDADLHRSLADYEENSALAKKIGTSSKTEALVGARINKTANEITLSVDIFLVADGQMIGQESLVTSERWALRR